MQDEVETNILNLANAAGQSRMKIERGEQHIKELEALIKSYVESDDPKVFEHADSIGISKEYVQRAKVMPNNIPLAIGDAFHNFSCALDYLSTAVVREFYPKNRRTTFPSKPTKQELADSFDTSKKDQNRTFTLACQPFVTFVMDKLQPYEGGNFCIWEVRQADNLDKHNLIIPTISLSNLSDIEIQDVNRNVVRIGRSTVSMGGELGLAKFSAASFMTRRGTPSANVDFSTEVKGYAGKPVLPTLKIIARNFAEIVDLFEKELKDFARTAP